MIKPKISVVTPVYNTAKYLDATLESVMNQTFADFEMICIDDCSSDSSYDVLQRYAAQDGRIRVVKNAVNIGAGLTRNVGLDLARGDYIYFFDSDDRLSPGYLQNMFEVAERTGAEIVFNANIMRYFKGGNQPYDCSAMPEIPEEGVWIDNVRMCHTSPVLLWARLFRRDFIEDNRIRFVNLRTQEDDEFHYLTNICSRRSFAFRGEEYKYSVHNEGLCGQVIGKPDHDLFVARFFDALYDDIKRRGLLNSVDVKMFGVYPFYRIDRAEKFDAFKALFVKMLDEHYMPMQRLYNSMERYFFDSVVNSADFESFRAGHNPSPTMDFILAKRKGLVK